MPRKIRGPFEYLDDAGTQEFIDTMQELSDEQFTNIIITEDNNQEPSDDNVFSAAYILNIFIELWELIASAQTKIDNIYEDALATTNLDPYRHLHISFVTGDIDVEVPEPDPDILYFQHDYEEDDTWVLYINGGDGWMVVGETKDVLENYWSKDISPEEIGMQIIPVLSDEKIIQKVDRAFHQIVR